MTKRIWAAGLLVMALLALVSSLAPIGNSLIPMSPVATPTFLPAMYLPLVQCDGCATPTPTQRPTLPPSTDTPTPRPTLEQVP
jgi:hypothetical protein